MDEDTGLRQVDAKPRCDIALHDAYMMLHGD